jgi:hypothetical protein
MVCDLKFKYCAKITNGEEIKQSAECVLVTYASQLAVTREVC